MPPLLLQFLFHQLDLLQHTGLGGAAVTGAALTAGGQVDGSIHVLVKQAAVLLELIQRQLFQRLALADAGGHHRAGAFVGIAERHASRCQTVDLLCKYYKLEPELIQTRSKKQEVAHARQIAMYLSKKYTDSSYARIGALLGKRNHATVIHACKTVNDWIETHKSLRSDIQTIEKILFQ